MIKNDKQYQVTKNRLKEFTEALALLNEQELDPLLRELQEGSVKSKIEDFKEINEYEMLKQGQVSQLTISSLDDFPELLIKGRIAKGWTQANLADKMEMKEQQIQRYEASDYETANLLRLLEIAHILNLDIYPITVKIGEPVFIIPEGMNSKTVYEAQLRISQRKICIAV